MAFTTVAGAASTDATSYVGTSGIDALALVNPEGPLFVGAQQAADVLTITDSGSALYGAAITSATIKGGAGADAINFAGNARGMTLANGFINLNAGDDTLTMRAADNVAGASIFGGQGADTITTGVLSASFLNGNKGNDTLTVTGNSVSSTARGGAGNDAIAVNANFTSSLIAGDAGNDTFTSSVVGNALTSSTVQGNAGNDTVNFAGQTGSTLTLRGGADNDTVTGGTLDDTIFGDAGNDSITGGTGDDSITTGDGNDTVLNEAATAASATAVAATIAVGNSVTFANGIDVITDFTTANDRMNVATTTAIATLVGVVAATGFTIDSLMVSASGTFTAATGTFTFAADGAGPDTLIAQTGAAVADAFSNLVNFQVLSGVTTNLGITLV